MSPPVIATIPPTVSQNTSTKPKQYNKNLLNPELYKNGKLVTQEKIHKTLDIPIHTYKHTRHKTYPYIATLNFRDTGFLSNAKTAESTT